MSPFAAGGQLDDPLHRSHLHMPITRNFSRLTLSVPPLDPPPPPPWDSRSCRTDFLPRETYSPSRRKKFGPIFKELLTFLPKKCSICSQIYGFGIRDPRSGIRKKPLPDPGSRGQKGTGSRIRIRNTVFYTPIDHTSQKRWVCCSEWMGFYLLHESMLDSVIRARDKHLQVNILMYTICWKKFVCFFKEIKTMIIFPSVRWPKYKKCVILSVICFQFYV